MSAEAVVYSLLSQSAAITAVVGDKVYPTVLPQGVHPPAVVYDLISSVPWGAIDAATTTHLMRSRVQVSLVGPDYADLHSMRADVVAALRHQRGTIAGAQVHAILLDMEGPPSFDDDLGLWLRPIDFIVLHQQA